MVRFYCWRFHLQGSFQGDLFVLTTSTTYHFNKDTAKDQHKRALDRANTKAKADGTREIKVFQPTFLGTQPLLI